MKKIIRIVGMQLAGLLAAMHGFGQENQWIVGAWNGGYFGEKSKLTKTFDTRLIITKLNGSRFEGVVQCILPSDTTVRLHTRITGRIYATHIMTKLHEVVYYKDPPGNYTWAKTCSACDSMKYTFKQKGDSIILQGERHCDSLCNIVARYAKSVGPMVYRAAYLYDPDISPRMPPKTVAHPASYAHPTGKEFLASRDFLAGRTVHTDARYIVNTDSVEIRLMDNGIIDGDTVSLFYNGQKIVTKLGLKEKPFIIKLPVFKEAPNILVLYAESLGEYPPNTALVRVLYGKQDQSFLLSTTLSKSSSIELLSSNNGITSN